MSATVRRAGPTDQEALLPVIARFCEIDGHPFDEALVAGALAPLLDADDAGVVLVIEDAGVIAGYGVLTWGWSLESGGREALVDELYVDQRDCGHGSRLLVALMEAAREHGARAIFLETEAPNERVRRFYARHGFLVEPSTWMSIGL